MHLFFYGVLREGVADWPFLEGLGLGAPATTMGMMYANPYLGSWYPALIPTQARYATVVHGTIHEAGAVDLKAIDEFEGEDYTRQALDIDGWDGFGETQAQGYVWTADIPADAELIAGGDFVEWLAQTGRKAFSQV